MSKPVTNPFITAYAMFTTLPSPDVGIVDRSRSARTILWLPWVGMILGALAGSAALLVLLLGGGRLLAAIAGLALLCLTTGFLHLDGLADTADGLGSRKPIEQALEIMKRSDIGPMGVCAIVLVLALDVAALYSPANTGIWAMPALLLTAPMVARMNVLIATREGAETARPGGFGALFASVTKPATIAISLAAMLLAVGCVSGLVSGFSPYRIVHSTVAVLLSVGIGTLWQRHLVVRFGGSTGDTFGSLIEISQMCYLLASALGATLPSLTAAAS